MGALDILTNYGEAIALESIGANHTIDAAVNSVTQG